MTGASFLGIKFLLFFLAAMALLVKLKLQLSI